MRSSIRTFALLGCATFVLGGCAMQQNAAPEYRLSSSTQAISPGTSMLQQGRAKLDAGLNALAIEAFRAEIRVNPESADAYNGLAVAYGRIGRSDLAQRYFETALAKEPGNIRAQANLARLTGKTEPLVEFAEVIHPLPASEPVSVAMVTGEPAGQLTETAQIPILPSPITIPMPAKKPQPPVYPLPKQGVLSTRFAVAPARLATVAASVRVAQDDKPLLPPASPAPSLPPANLPFDHRGAGARLVRVSLGEVHLVTRSAPPIIATASSQSEFGTFGDRLATWLPQSIAVEQARAGNTRREASVLMAAIERAEQQQKIAAVNEIALPEMPDFAYLFIDAAEPHAHA